MALLEILHYPDNRLRTVAKKVQSITKIHHKLIDDMFETMYHAPGIGLAATQINFHEQIIVIDLSEEKNEPLVLINPTIIEVRNTEIMEEGCLSIPETHADIERSESIVFEALDKKGKLFQMDVNGLFSVCVQHEIDHLKGKLFVDYLSKLKRERIKKKIIKLDRKQK